MLAKSLTLAVLLATTTVLAAEPVQNDLNNLAKRPYTAAAKDSEEGKYQGLNEPKETNAASERNYKTLQLNMLGKRPYSEKTGD